MSTKPNIVLVHGAWADGSSWSAVIERLQADGFRVIAPQFPLTALADDVARLRQVLEFQDGPTLVVGHSYGGQIMTSLGTNAPNVVGLVYIAAFGLDEGESLGALLAQGPVTPALKHPFTDKRGFTWLSEDDFVNHFAADVDSREGKGDVLGATGLGWVRVHRCDGNPGMEVCSLLVPRRQRRPGDSPGSRDAVRAANGRHNGRGPFQPCCDGLSSRCCGRPRRAGGRNQSGELITKEVGQHKLRRREKRMPTHVINGRD